MSKLKLQKLVLPKAKPWYKSRTVWVGVATCVAGANQLLPHLAAVLSPVVMGILLFSIGLLNVALRFVTTEGIKGVVANDKS